MPKVTFIHADASVDEIDAVEGASIMRTALANGVKGIVGECGGELMCATCHVYVREPVGVDFDISEDEDEMLDFAVCPRRENSRLSCQIKMTAATDGIVVETPEEQN